MSGIREKFRSVVEMMQSLRSGVTPQSHSDHFPFPRLIATGLGGSIEISKEIDELIASIAVDLMKEVSARATTYTEEEWRTMVRRAFGPALANLDNVQEDDQATDVVMIGVQEYLSKIDEAITPYEYSFGLTLFPDHETGAFAIGPVRFEPRADWLNRKSMDCAVTTITKTRVLKAWRGEKLLKRRSSRDSMHEQDILTAIGGCPWVVSVETTGLANDAGKQRALTAARMATAVISLLWSKSSSVLNGMNLLVDRSVRSEKVLTFIPGRRILAGSKMIGRPSAPYLSKEDWEKSLNEFNTIFKTAAQVISFYLDPTGNVLRPKIMNMLAQAILWFHEGCRETVTLMAIVKFTATLDGLANGRQSNGIKKMITARLGIARNDIIFADGTTMNATVELIYSQGRSRTIHGTNDKLGHDWTSTRDRAEEISRLCLIYCMEWVGNNTNTDDPQDLQS